jgi:transposase-like protein
MSDDNDNNGNSKDNSINKSNSSDTNNYSPKHSPDKVKAKRKRFTFDDKLEIARKARGKSVASVARAEGLNESTLRGWVKAISELEDAVENDNEVRKARHADKTPTLTNALIKFFYEQQQCTAGVETTAAQHANITIDCLSSKALELSKQLILEHEQHPMNSSINSQEVRVLTNHRFSSSWAYKWLQRNGNLRRGSRNAFRTRSATTDEEKEKEDVQNETEEEMSSTISKRKNSIEESKLLTCRSATVAEEGKKDDVHNETEEDMSTVISKQKHSKEGNKLTCRSATVDEEKEKDDVHNETDVYTTVKEDMSKAISKQEHSIEENKLTLVHTINALYQTIKLEQELNVDTSDTWEEIKLAKAQLKKCSGRLYASI